jgi:hypothetical protein
MIDSWLCTPALVSTVSDVGLCCSAEPYEFLLLTVDDADYSVRCNTTTVCNPDVLD